jgi:hypothetical protein
MAESETILASHLALIEQLYDRLRSGVDVAPGERLRLEGRLELLVELGIASHKQLEEAISQRTCVFLVNRSIRFIGSGWPLPTVSIYPVVQILHNWKLIPNDYRPRR